jgi:hypothetical protein
LCPALSFKKIVPNIKNQAVNLQTKDIMKAQRVYGFLVVLLLIITSKIYSQQQMPLIAQNMPPGLQSFPIFQNPDVNPSYFFKDQLLKKNYACNLYNDALFVIKSDFYLNYMGFFCRKELMIEKMTSIPFRLRLGSLEYVNRIEGKDRFVTPRR